MMKMLPGLERAAERILCIGGPKMIRGRSLITRRVWMPVQLEIEDVAESELTDGQRLYFDDIARSLGPLGLDPARTYRVANLQGFNLVRSYLSEVDPIILSWGALGAVFALLGLATGLLFGSKSFLWTFLLAWVPLRLLGPALVPAFVLSLWAGGVAGAVCTRRMRSRALV